ncbi:substrate-binding periplasmic protein [Burkholderia cepacia]|uniref:substrate-binding periplasmic protein n=1 Tax=Burkholderia cepacia TaxID=292 RepID=UPI002AB7DA31|nr:ABC transporter substrate-binding protein [Burkholderia cepacia]
MSTLFRNALVFLFIGFITSIPALADPASQLDVIKKRGVLVVGFAPDAPPMGSIGADGAATGFAPDLARAVARDLHVNIQFKPIAGQLLIPAIRNGEIDAMFASTTPTQAREEVLDFTIVYNWDSVVPLVRAGESGVITDYKPPKKVATTKNNYAAQLFTSAVPGGNVVFFEQYDDAVNALRAKQVDAVLLNRFSATTYARRYNNALKVGDSFFTDPQAIVVHQNDSRWRNYLNWTLQRIWARGEFANLYEKNFGYKPQFSLWSAARLQPGITP